MLNIWDVTTKNPQSISLPTRCEARRKRSPPPTAALIGVLYGLCQRASPTAVWQGKEGLEVVAARVCFRPESVESGRREPNEGSCPLWFLWGTYRIHTTLSHRLCVNLLSIYTHVAKSTNHFENHLTCIKCMWN
jgi:hypothetical protein